MKTKFEQFKENKNLRFIEDNEIVLECDNRKIGFEGINFIAINLFKAGYNFEIWYAEGQKSPHIHVKNILFLDLQGEQLKRYKELFLKKYTPKEYLDYSDFTLCSKHLIAEENKPHFKYKTVKKFLNVWNEDKENFAEQDLIEEATQEEKIEISINFEGSDLKDKIKITDIAKHYGLKVKGYMAICPFHSDTNPSLSLSNNKGLFHCFGCNVSGDIIKFVQMLEDLKNG